MAPNSDLGTGRVTESAADPQAIAERAAPRRRSRSRARRRAWFALGALLLAAPLAVPVAQVVPNAAQRAFPETSTRGNARIFYWGGDRSAGQLTIDYGQPAWKDAYDAQIETQRGVRWRLGQNFWTNLDSNIDLRFGDVEVLAGHYYLVLERTVDGAFLLWLLDPVEIRDAHLDAFHAARTTGGIALPIAHREVATKSGALTMRLDVDAQRKDGAKLVIQFGRHELSADLTLVPDRG